MFAHSMRVSSTAKRFLVSASVLAVILLFLGMMIFERYRYYDYHEANCSTDEFLIKVELTGSFGSDHANKRSVPYFLRVEITPKVKKTSGPKGVDGGSFVLTSSATGKTVYLRKPSRHESLRNTVVYVVESIAAPFEDYELSGGVARTTTPTNQAQFQCRLRKTFSQEIRVPLWDKLLSA